MKSELQKTDSSLSEEEKLALDIALKEEKEGDLLTKEEVFGRDA